MIPSELKLTGRVYIKYLDLISDPKLGDIKLFLNDDAVAPIKGDYENLNSRGYIKAMVYDGRVWQNISIRELCSDKEFKFSKRQKAIDSALLCKDIISTQKGTNLYRTYRRHFSTQN